MQGGRIELGAPTGRWQMIVVYRGKHCPVSKNYLASLQQIYYELDELGVEVIAVSGDGRERAEAFVTPKPMSVAFTSCCCSVMGKGRWAAQKGYCLSSSLPRRLVYLSDQHLTRLCDHIAPEEGPDVTGDKSPVTLSRELSIRSDSMRGLLRVQLEALKATTDTKEVSFKIAYGLPISEMLNWGLYISGAASSPDPE